MSNPLFSHCEKKLFLFLQDKNYHLLEDFLKHENVDVNVRGGTVTPMQVLMDSITPVPQKTTNQTKKAFKKKLELLQFSFITEVDIFKLLVSHGLNVAQRNRDGKSYLLSAAQKGRTDLIEAFSQAGMPFTTEDIKTARKAAGEKGYTKTEKYLLNLQQKILKQEKVAVPKLLQTFAITSFVLGTAHSLTQNLPETSPTFSAYTLNLQNSR